MFVCLFKQYVKQGSAFVTLHHHNFTNFKRKQVIQICRVHLPQCVRYTCKFAHNKRNMSRNTSKDDLTPKHEENSNRTRENSLLCCERKDNEKSCCDPGGYNVGTPPPNVMEDLKLGYEKIHAANSKSLLRQCLTREVFDSLKYRMTSYHSTLLDVVRSGYENVDCDVGVYAPDPEAYSVFDCLFDCVIEKYHGFSPSNKHPDVDWGDPGNLPDLDPSGELIASTRVRCGRSIQGFPLNPKMTEKLYKKMEKRVCTEFSCLEGVFSGSYKSLCDMNPEEKQKLINDHYLFKEGDKHLEAAHAIQFWPTGRGIYMNKDKTFLVWVGEEDHLRIISMQKGGHLGEVYGRLMNGAKELENRLKFVRHERFGYVTFCPTNLGTSIRASALMKLPKLSKNIKQLDALAAQYNLQVRGSAGEHSASPDGLYDISNKRRLGVTEFEAVKEMFTGLKEIIKMEKSK